MTRISAAVLIAVFATACSAFTQETASMVFTNEAKASGALFVNGVSVLDFKSLETGRFNVKVDVSRPRYDGYGTGPSQVNRITSITVSVLNRDANARSNTQTCYAGAKITTSIKYKVYSYDPGGTVSCETLDAYGRIIPEGELIQMAKMGDGGGSQ